MKSWISAVKGKVHRKAWRYKIERFRGRYRKEPAPLDLCHAFQQKAFSVFGRANILVPPQSQIRSKGNIIKDRELAELLRDDELGVWPLTADCIDWLVDYLHRERPKTVLEFGSGISTVCLCVVLQRIHGSDGFRLISIEQDPVEARKTSERLSMFEGRNSCRVLHVPLARMDVNGQQTFCYDIVNMPRENFEWLGNAEFILIDGPFGDGPCRYATISQVRNYLAHGARFAMDDALREKEITAGLLWTQENMVVDGVLTIGEGLMVGSIPSR